MIDAIQKFRKKYTLALLLYLAGTSIAILSKASLGEYTMFTATLLTIFGGTDLVDKKLENKK